MDQIGNAFSKSNPNKFWEDICDPIPIQKNWEFKNCIQESLISEYILNWIIFGIFRIYFGWVWFFHELLFLFLTWNHKSHNCTSLKRIQMRASLFSLRSKLTRFGNLERSKLWSAPYIPEYARFIIYLFSSLKNIFIFRNIC